MRSNILFLLLFGLTNTIDLQAQTEDSIIEVSKDNLSYSIIKPKGWTVATSDTNKNNIDIVLSKNNSTATIQIKSFKKDKNNSSIEYNLSLYSRDTTIENLQEKDDKEWTFFKIWMEDSNDKNYFNFIWHVNPGLRSEYLFEVSLRQPIRSQEGNSAILKKLIAQMSIK